MFIWKLLLSYYILLRFLCDSYKHIVPATSNLAESFVDFAVKDFSFLAHYGERTQSMKKEDFPDEYKPYRNSAGGGKLPLDQQGSPEPVYVAAPGQQHHP